MKKIKLHGKYIKIAFIAATLVTSFFTQANYVEEKITIDDIVKSDLSSTLRDCSQVIDILNCLSQKYDMKVENVVSDEEFITNIIDQLEEKFTGNRKVEFLSEQLSIVFTKSNGRRYSPSLLAMSSLWEITSSALYKQICGEDVLTLPHY